MSKYDIPWLISRERREDQDFEDCYDAATKHAKKLSKAERDLGKSIDQCKILRGFLVESGTDETMTAGTSVELIETLLRKAHARLDRHETEHKNLFIAYHDLKNGANSGNGTDPDAKPFKLALVDYNDNKVAVIKVLKDRLGLGLSEAKQMAEDAPIVVGEFACEYLSYTLRQALEDAGATVGQDHGKKGCKPLNNLPRQARALLDQLEAECEGMTANECTDELEMGEWAVTQNRVDQNFDPYTVSHSWTLKGLQHQVAQQRFREILLYDELTDQPGGAA